MRAQALNTVHPKSNVRRVSTATEQATKKKNMKGKIQE